MALFGRDYDREYGYGARPRGDRMYGAGRTGYGREFETGSTDPGYRGAGYGGMSEYDLDYGYKSRWQTDYGDPYGDRASNTPIRMVRGEFEPDYGADYMSRDRGFRGGEYGRPSRGGGYPMSYDPYETQGRGYQGRPGGWGGRWNREAERGGRWGQGGQRPGRWNADAAPRGYQGYSENRYDTGWF